MKANKNRLQVALLDFSSSEEHSKIELRPRKNKRTMRNEPNTLPMKCGLWLLWLYSFCTLAQQVAIFISNLLHGGSSDGMRKIQILKFLCPVFACIGINLLQNPLSLGSSPMSHLASSICVLSHVVWRDIEYSACLTDQIVLNPEETLT